MPNSEDYRKYLEEKFEGQAKNFHAHFENINDKLDEIIEHQKITNGRVAKNEDKIGCLEDWQTEVKAVEAQKGKSFGRILGIASVIIAFGILMVSVFAKMNDTEESVKKIIDDYGMEVHTRGVHVIDTI